MNKTMSWTPKVSIMQHLQHLFLIRTVKASKTFISLRYEAEICTILCEFLPSIKVWIYMTVSSWLLILAWTMYSYLPSAPPSHTQGTWSELAGLTGPPCSSSNSSWSFVILGIARSRLCRLLVSWGGCTARWIAAQLWKTVGRGSASRT